MDALSKGRHSEKTTVVDVSELASDFEKILNKRSTFSSNTITLYADKIRRDEGDPRLISQITSALLYQRNCLSGLHHGDASPPPDLEFLLELWQENDRQDQEHASKQSSAHLTRDDPSSSTVLKGLAPTFDAAEKELQKQQQLSDTRSSGGQSQRHIVIPEPHLPCVIDLDDLEKVRLSQLTSCDHNRGRAVILRRLGAPVHRRGRSLVAVADDTGSGTFLELVGIYSIFENTVLSAKIRFAIKEPYVTTGRDVSVCIRVFHPSDIMCLDEPVPTGPNKSGKEWKEYGNAMFKARKFGEAAHAYESGLKAKSDEIDLDLESDLHRNLAQAYLNLGLYGGAIARAESSLDCRELSADTSTSSNGCEASDLFLSEKQKSNDAKACYRAAMAAYRLRDFGHAKSSLEKMLKLTPDDMDGKVELVRVCKRLNEELNAAYDFDDIISRAIAKRPEVDAASFTLRTMKRSSAGKGNGLFATRDLEIGDIVLCEKAYSSDFATGAKEDVLRTFNTSTGIHCHASTDLWTKTLQEAFENSSRAPILMSLGGAYQGLGSEEIEADGSRVIDAFQVHDIVQRNAFAIPSPSPRAKNENWGLYKVQSGEGSTSMTTGNYALFCHTALINHSCLPNVDKRFIGDLIIIRATKPIKKREEILLDYTPAGYDDMEEFDMEYERTWQFKCDCKECEAARKEDASVRKRRIELSKEARDLAFDLSTGLPESIKSTTKISRLEKMVDIVNATYDPKIYSGLPRKAMTYLLLSLAATYGHQKDYGKSEAALRKTFGSLGFESPLEVGGKLVPLQGHITFLDMHVPYLLHLSATIAERTKRLEIASAVKKLEPQIYLALNGVMNGFKSIDQRKREP